MAWTITIDELRAERAAWSAAAEASRGVRYPEAAAALADLVGALRRV